MRLRRFVLSAGLMLGVASTGQAATLIVQSDVADYEAYVSTSGGGEAISNGTGGDVRVGARTSSTLSSAIFGFELPTLNPGVTVIGATLTITVEGESNRSPHPGANLDLYGLSFEAGGFTQDASRQYIGPNDVTLGATKLQDNFITDAEAPGGNDVTTYTETSSDFGAYLQSLYTAGAVGGDFAVLRISQDVVPPSGNIDRFRLVSTSGDGGTLNSSPHTIAEGAPYLTITTIPEPGSIALATLAAVGLAARRRSKR